MDNNNLKDIGLFISKRRKKMNLTQNELASLINVSFKTISKWETGHNFPDLAYQRTLCKILKITLDELHDGKINKKMRIIKMLTTITTILFIIFIPIFIYLIIYYYQNKDTFNINSFTGIDKSVVLRGNFIEHHLYNTLIINDFILDDEITENDIFNLDIYYNNRLQYHSNKANDIFFNTNYKFDNKWTFTISINEKIASHGYLSFNKSIILTPKEKNKLLNDNSRIIIDKLINSGFVYANENQLLKKETNYYCEYFIDSNRFIYHYNKNYLIMYYPSEDYIEAYIYQNNGNIRTIIEKYTYHYQKDELECIVGICSSKKDILKIMDKYRSLLLGE